jgi:hypothetical protein
MSDPSRKLLFTRLAELSDRYPHWRFGQLLANVAGWADVDVRGVEDEQLLVAAEAHLSKMKRDVPATRRA